MMRATQPLPSLFPPAPTESPARPGVWRAVLDRLLHIFALIQSLARAATDNTRLSAETLRDIGLVRGEPPYVGAWDHYRMDCRQ